MNPKDALIEGARILEPVLFPAGFRFYLRAYGTGSGGNFASGEFARDGRWIEFHFRYSLGLVCYRVGDQSASHESYMRELGVWEKCRYPNFAPEVAAQFSALAEDLRWAGDFISGSASILKKAAEGEAARVAKQDQEAMYAYSGDPALIREMRDLLRRRKYKELLKVEQRLRYPERIEKSVRQMIAIARKRVAQK